MPLIIRKRGAKYRLLERDTGKIATRADGKPIDGGGKASKEALKPQLAAVNLDLERRKGRQVPKPRQRQ